MPSYQEEETAKSKAWLLANVEKLEGAFCVFNIGEELRVFTIGDNNGICQTHASDVLEAQKQKRIRTLSSQMYGGNFR